MSSVICFVSFIFLACFNKLYVNIILTLFIKHSVVCRVLHKVSLFNVNCDWSELDLMQQKGPNDQVWSIVKAKMNDHDFQMINYALLMQRLTAATIKGAIVLWWITSDSKFQTSCQIGSREGNNFQTICGFSAMLIAKHSGNIWLVARTHFLHCVSELMIQNHWQCVQHTEQH